jgi:type VI secretion system secreted protein Hcp
MKSARLVHPILVLTFVAIMLPPFVATAAMNMFVQITGIPGESQDVFHKDWIDAKGYGDSLLNTVIRDIGGGGVAGRPEIAPIKIIKFLDKASVGLRTAVLSGEHILKVQIEFSAAEAPSKLILKIELENVLITEVSTTWASSSPDRPQELVAFVPLGMIKWTYRLYLPNGAFAGQIEGIWNITPPQV